MKSGLQRILTVVLFVVVICAEGKNSVSAADPPKPAQDLTADSTQTSPILNKVTVDTSNVILSRELVKFTKLQEFLLILQQQILGAKPSFSIARSVDNVDAITVQIDQAKELLRLTRDILAELKEKVSSLESASQETIVDPSTIADAQPENNEESKFAEILSQLRTLEKMADDEELQIGTTSTHISRLSQKAAQLKEDWTQKFNEAMGSASAIQNLEGLFAASEIALPQIAGIVSMQAFPQYVQSSPQLWADSDRFEGTRSMSSMPQPTAVPGLSGQQLRTLASSKRQLLVLRLQKLDEEIVRSEKILVELDEDTKAIGRISKDTVAATAATDALRKSLIEKIQNKMTRNQARIITLEETLAFRDEDLNQYQINQLLVYAVYGMIASIIGSFILLRVYPSSLTGLVLEQRVIVEVLSMGFLLVTVIILGSAKIITGEGLAGLLGTIAGYIFVKKTSESMGADRNGSGGSVIDRALDAAHLDLVNVKVALAEQKASAGESPSDAAKKRIAMMESKLQQAESRVQSLSDIASAKSARAKE